MVRKTQHDENDKRMALFEAIMNCPHAKELEKINEVHAQIAGEDPLFYRQFAAWYVAGNNGTIRDHQELFTTNLLLSKNDRDTGCALLREFPPYQVLRIVEFITGTKTKKITKPKKGKGTVAPIDTEPKIEIVRHGLHKNAPRCLKTEVTRYLRERESDVDWFDSTVLVARHALKRLYKTLKIKPSPRAQKILFERDMPADSKLAAVKALRDAATPVDQARVISELKVPYRIATSVVTAMTPTVLVAIVESMSPQELLNNLGSLRRRGAFDNADIKKIIDGKLEKAKKATNRVSGMRAKIATEASGVSNDIAEKVAEVGDAQVRNRGKITKSTAVLVDCSASQEKSIELGKRVAAMVSGACDTLPVVYAFNTAPYAITSKGSGLSHWETAFVGVRATGGTSCGCAVAAMQRAKQKVEQIVLVTDEEENSTPLFAPAVIEYARHLGVPVPNVVIVRVPTSHGVYHKTVEQACIANKIDVQVLQIKADTDAYALPGLLPMVAGGSRLDLILDIMAFPLPKRKDQVSELVGV